jgi:hypothetical protein
MPNAGRNEKLRLAALALLAPLIALCLRAWMWADPMHVLLFPDPDYGYLFSSLLLIDGKTPWHIDHPGTPVQLLGVLVMKLRYALAGSAATIAEDFFLNQVSYHQWVVHSLFGIFLTVLWSAGYLLLRMGVGILLSLTITLLPLTYFDLLDYADHVSPECILAGFSLLLVPILLRATKGGAWPALATGCLIALLCTLKATAIPLLICLFLLPGKRERLTGLASAAFFYLFFTAAIWPEYPRMLGWYLNLGTRPGVYGHGSGAPTSLSLLLTNMKGLLSGGQWNGNLAALFLFPLLLAVPAQGMRRWPLALSGAVLLLLILKHPATRYLLPFIALSGLSVARAVSLPRFAQIALAAILLFPAPFLLKTLVNGRSGWQQQEAQAAIALHRRLESEDLKACNVTVVNEVSHGYYALFAGNFATAMHSYGAPLQATFPRASFHFNQVRFFGDVATPGSWKTYVASAPCHIFVGRPKRTEAVIKEIFGADPILLETFGEGKNSAIYRVRDPAKLHRLPPNEFVPAGMPDTFMPLVSPSAQ